MTALLRPLISNSKMAPLRPLISNSKILSPFQNNYRFLKNNIDYFYIKILIFMIQN